MTANIQNAKQAHGACTTFFEGEYEWGFELQAYWAVRAFLVEGMTFDDKTWNDVSVNLALHPGMTPRDAPLWRFEPRIARSATSATRKQHDAGRKQRDAIRLTTAERKRYTAEFSGIPAIVIEMRQSIKAQRIRFAEWNIGRHTKTQAKYAKRVQEGATYLQYRLDFETKQVAYHQRALGLFDSDCQDEQILALAWEQLYTSDDSPAKILEGAKAAFAKLG